MASILSRPQWVNDGMASGWLQGICRHHINCWVADNPFIIQRVPSMLHITDHWWGESIDHYWINLLQRANNAESFSMSWPCHARKGQVSFQIALYLCHGPGLPTTLMHAVCNVIRLIIQVGEVFILTIKVLQFLPWYIMIFCLMGRATLM